MCERRHVMVSISLLLLTLPDIRMLHNKSHTRQQQQHQQPMIFDDETGMYFAISNLSLRIDPTLVLPPPNPKEFPPDYLDSLLRHCDDPNPSLGEFVQNTMTGLKEFGLNWERYPISATVASRILQAIQPSQLWHVFIMAIMLSVLRYALEKCILQTVIQRLEMKMRPSQRLIESAWKGFWFLTLWVNTFHVLIMSGRTDFQYPLRIFKGVRMQVGYFDIPTPSDYYNLYVLQMGFYLHSLWTVLFIDVWRKDSGVLLVHHCMTLLLLQFSLVLRLHRIGALVVFLHDLNDVFLELAKINVYLQHRNGKLHAIHTNLSNLFFAIFAMLWVVMRLYWFPLKVLYTTSWGLYITNVGREYRSFLFFNIMLWSLYGMHIYWFRFIVMMAVRLIFRPSASDVRESDDSDTGEEEEAEAPAPIHKLNKQPAYKSTLNYANSTLHSSLNNGTCLSNGVGAKLRKRD